MGYLPKYESAGWTFDPEFEVALVDNSYAIYHAMEALMVDLVKCAAADDSLVAQRDQARTITLALHRLHEQLAHGPESESDEDEDKDEETDDAEDAE